MPIFFFSAMTMVLIRQNAGQVMRRFGERDKAPRTYPAALDRANATSR
jgi:hypothetical protein